MQFIQKIKNVTRGLVQRYGTEAAKRRLWNKEYSAGRWDHLELHGDFSVERLVEKFARHGMILDLGCGSGNVSVNLYPEAYSGFTGVDISDVAIAKARQRVQKNGCADKCLFVQSDILTYQPMQRYSVILFGDSIYYIPSPQIAPMLRRYSSFLMEEGFFIARLFDESGKRHDILDTIQNHFAVAESHAKEQSRLIVFRPRLEHN